MLKSLKDILFGGDESTLSGESINSTDKVAVATCALMLEMAYADDEFSEDEQKKILKILVEKYRIAADDALDLIELANTQRKTNIDLWQFTHKINESYSKDEKLDVARNLWEIIYSDGKVDKHEEYLMRKLTSLLNLSHGDMIQAKIDTENSK